MIVERSDFFEYFIDTCNFIDVLSSKHIYVCEMYVVRKEEKEKSNEGDDSINAI